MKNKRVKPKKIRIRLEYYCPYCEFYHEVSSKKSTCGYIVCDYCEERFDIYPCRLQMQTANDSVIISKAPKFNIDSIKTALASFGLSDEQIQKLMVKTIEDGHGSSEEELLKSCISNINSFEE